MKIFSTLLSVLVIMVLVSCGSSSIDTVADGNSSDIALASNTNASVNKQENFRKDMQIEYKQADESTESLDDKRKRNKKLKEQRAQAKQNAIDGQYKAEPVENLKSENAIVKVPMPKFRTTTNQTAWSSSDVTAFTQYCLKSMNNNKSFDGPVYCNCLLDIMKDNYAPAKMTQAVKENPKALQCLKTK